MSRLVVDNVSARSLPVLDKFYREDNEKFNAIVNATSGEPLVRLLKASVARQSVNGRPELMKEDASRLVELLIYNNLASVDGDKNEEEFDEVCRVTEDWALRLLLKISVARFVVFNIEG